eukprot:753020-Hanusia_phi.AAC.7
MDMLTGKAYGTRRAGRDKKEPRRRGERTEDGGVGEGAARRGSSAASYYPTLPRLKPYPVVITPPHHMRANGSTPTTF